MKTIINGKSVIGDREYQQDEYYFNADKGQAVVCDGMGGMKNGEAASKCALRHTIRFFERNEYTENSISKNLRQLAENINKEICNLTDENGKKINSGTTIVLTVIFENRLYMMAIGDSRIYLIRNKEIYIMTREHNYKLQLDEKLRRNLIDEREYNANIECGEILISYLGVPKLQLVDVSLEPFEMKNEDIVILCSDGLYKSLDNEQILAVVLENYYDLEMCATELLDTAKRLSRKQLDNTTAILIKYEE